MDAADEPDGATAASYDDWNQCSVFRPSDPAQLPGYLGFDPATEWLFICTQTCSICGPGSSAEPRIEVIVGKPLAEYDPKSQAALGKKVASLHLRFEEGAEFVAIALDISRRAFLPREVLGSGVRAKTPISISTLGAFQGWMARYYSRIAMPDALVKRIRAENRNGIQRRVLKLLNQHLPLDDGLGRYQVHSEVSRFYVGWSPDKELPGDQPYILKLLVVCTTERTKKHLEVELEDLESGMGSKELVNGIAMTAPEVRVGDNVTDADKHNMKRFSEWDELSSASEMLGVLRS